MLDNKVPQIQQSFNVVAESLRREVPRRVGVRALTNAISPQRDRLYFASGNVLTIITFCEIQVCNQNSSPSRLVRSTLIIVSHSARRVGSFSFAGLFAFALAFGSRIPVHRAPFRGRLAGTSKRLIEPQRVVRPVPFIRSWDLCPFHPVVSPEKRDSYIAYARNDNLAILV